MRWETFGQTGVRGQETRAQLQCLQDFARVLLGGRRLIHHKRQRLKF